MGENIIAESVRKIKSLEASLLGNRIDVIGKIALGLSSLTYLKGLDEFIEDNMIKSSGYVMLATFIGITGIAISGIMEWGESTRKIYKRTKRHIQRFGEIDEKFVVTVLEEDAKGRYVGYCQLQGMYLAAREFGQVKKFREIKKKCSENVIPNF